MDGERTQDLRDAERRFAALLDRSEALRLARLRFDELRELGQLYRLHAARLARLRERGDDPDAIRHLNALCVRAYTLLYGESSRRWSARGAPGLPAEALARAWRALAAAWALLLVGVLVGWALAARDPTALLALVPTGLGYTPVMLDELATSPEARRDFLERSEHSLGQHAFFGSSLFAHNTRVGLLALATGMLAGIPSVILQIYNGLVMGALSAAFLDGDARVEYLAWILPHAIPELTAICLCVAGGLLLGAAVAAPGRLPRALAVRRAFDSALLLFGFSVPFFLGAALIESFVRQSMLGTAPRLALAAVLFGGLLCAHALVRRLARRRPPSAAWLSELSDPIRSGARDSD